MPNEIAFRDFIESIWFKGLSRLAMIVAAAVLTVAGPLFAWAVTDTRTRIVTLEHDVGLQQTFASSAVKAQKDIHDNVASVQSDITVLKIDMGVVRGILQEMQRRDLAESLSQRARELGKDQVAPASLSLPPVEPM